MPDGDLGVVGSNRQPKVVRSCQYAREPDIEHSPSAALSWEHMTTRERPATLITGATGFIGGRLARRLIAHGHRVICLVRPNSNADSLRSIGAQLVWGDIADRASVARALAGVEICTVFHAAGCVRVSRRAEFTRVNAAGAGHVASACAMLASPPVFVLVSSLAAAGPTIGDQARVEGDTPEPISHYGRSKLAGERAVAAFAEAMPISVLRPSIVFGPSDRGLLQVFRPIARWGLHPVPGWEGRDRRFSIVYVDDLVDALMLAAEKGERLDVRSRLGHGIYFIADEARPTYVELGLAIADALGRKRLAARRVPGPVLRLLGVGADVASWLRRRPSWINSDKIAEALAGSWICAAIKARSHLGWPSGPPVPLADRLRTTADWYRTVGWL
jgi:nucleoside-diphosphate-sugar epimerase